MQRILCFTSILLLFSACSYSQQETDPKTPDYAEWVTLTKGMEYREIDAPQKSFIGDSKISILRMDPQVFHFDLYTATQFDSIPRDLHTWADTFELLVAFNAGMYNLARPLQSRAYLKNGAHLNNGKLLENFNLMLALGPKPNSQRSNIEVLDLTCANWEQEQQNFSGFAQGLRMIDCNGNPMNWQKKVQSCSMLIAAEDQKGWFYLIFTRSPYTHNQMINFMIGMPYGLHDAIYLEGGPETSLLIDVNGHCIEKVGSWVSTTWERNDNNHFWRLPNIVGVHR
ncbi:MAG: phosphodiester glycosidase family protein [Flavobacteriales bacterium]